MENIIVVKNLLEPVGLTLLLILFYGVACRKISSKNIIDIIMGTLFGFAAFVAMIAPVTLGDGVILDLRSVFVIVSAALFGWRGALITASIAIAVRYGIGGAGATIGVVGIVITALAGLAWQRWISPRIANRFISVAILSIIVSGQLGLFVFLPAEFAAAFLNDFALKLVAMNFVATLAMTFMVMREQRMVDYERRLAQAVTIDPLTKALNRETVVAKYNKLRLSLEPTRGPAIICIDIDHFKQINDTYGHLIGDAVLVQLAQLIDACLRPDDLFARMSGDEFLIVLNNVSRPEMGMIAERCRASVAREPIDCGDKDISVTISLGASWASERQDFDLHRHSADDALYAAKAKGRDCFAANRHADRIKAA